MCSRISLILISQLTDWRVVFPHRITDIITLKPYSYEEIHQILADRVQTAFKSGVVSEETLGVITELVYQKDSLRYMKFINSELF